ncbi:6-hydroxymethylpterin diphosphokinase MptE-like protein [uncultured Desulfobacter sp.]|uniref:6-hydroxymethylpterin diphosphokinase MptE-like protein n=1 Tax=uncultured Desulfobacter sp. TaxID=240139 RepID=UPI0029C8D07B|nr:6-hydroxymethylpterin diphosphokinase MptE-like protein [uncultured Desulfobacter sp.]
MHENSSAVYQLNMALLKKRFRDVWDKVQALPKEKTRWVKLIQANGKPNIQVTDSDGNVTLIHNRQNPGQEGHNFLSTVDSESNGVVILMGMGLGYIALSLLKKCKHLQHIIIFELNVDFFALAMEQFDFRELLEDPRLLLSVGEDCDPEAALTPAKRALILENIFVYRHQQSYLVNPAYQTISPAIDEFISAHNMEGGTKMRYGNLFIENRLRHLTSMHHNRRLEDLTDKFKGLPCFMVAAGPSLDKNVAQLKKAVGRSVIISVDTALPVLLAHGIVPDFLTSIDYKENTYEKISHVASLPEVKEINLICTSWATHVVTKNFPAKNIYWGLGKTALENWMNSMWGSKIFINAAGTVAHLNFIAANLMGCDPLIFIGQDLAFSGSKDHASQVILSNYRDMKGNLASGKNIIWVDGINDNKLPTSSSLYNHKLAFESMIADSERKVINATEGGALIKGSSNMTLSDTVDLFCSRKIASLDLKPVNDRFEFISPMQSTFKRVQRLLSLIQKVETLLSSAQNLLSLLKKEKKRPQSFDMLPQKMKETMLAIDKFNHKADQDTLWPLFDEMTFDGLKQDERAKQELTKLEGDPRSYLEWMEKSLHRLIKVNTIRKSNLIWFKKKLKKLLDHHKKEKQLCQKIKKSEFKTEDLSRLADIYYTSGDFVLLEKTIDKYAECNTLSGKLEFYKGIIFLNRLAYEGAEQCFQKAIKKNADLKDTITRKLREIGDYYYREAVAVQEGVFDDRTARHILLKGLKACSDHEKIPKVLKNMAMDDIYTLRKVIASSPGELSANEDTLKDWCRDIFHERLIVECITQKNAVELILFYGKILIDREEYGDAVDYYLKGLALFDTPGLHIAATDALFAMDEFDRGLDHLKKAVALDKQFAKYWKNIGNNLSANGDYGGAIAAYEQYFNAVPEEIETLRKISECYLASGNPEASKKVGAMYRERAAGNLGEADDSFA